MLRPILAFVLAAAAATAPSLTGEEKPAAKAKPMLAGSELKDFKVVDEMKDHGPVTLKEGVLTLGAGMPLTGIVFTGKPENLPVQDYEVSFEARRTSGSDFSLP